MQVHAYFNVSFTIMATLTENLIGVVEYIYLSEDMG